MTHEILALACPPNVPNSGLFPLSRSPIIPVVKGKENSAAFLVAVGCEEGTDEEGCEEGCEEEGSEEGCEEGCEEGAAVMTNRRL